MKLRRKSIRMVSNFVHILRADRENERLIAGESDDDPMSSSHGTPSYELHTDSRKNGNRELEIRNI